MSHADTFNFDTGVFRRGGPGLNAYQVDRNGWMKRSKILRFGDDGVYDKEVVLSALSREASGTEFQMVRIPFDPFDLQRYYTIEYRVSEGWDWAFPEDVVLIHEVSRKNFTKCNDGSTIQGEYRSYVLSDKPSNSPYESINTNGVQIDVVSKNPSTRTAVVRIRTTKPELCIVGYVWREASPTDHVCTTVARRAEVAAENAAAANNRVPGGGNTCKQGFVWREAFSGDLVCVVPEKRTEAAAENTEAYYKRIGYAAYGPLTCKQGFVWREADGQDYVCVSVARRTEVREENNLAPTRVSPVGGEFGPDTCLQGFVWREAFPGDHVCVPPASRTTARSENEARTDNLSKDLTNNAAESEGDCSGFNCPLVVDEQPRHSPVATDDQGATTAGNSIDIDVSANDSDEDGNLNPLSTTVKTGSDNGTAVINGRNITYTPNPGFVGEDSFSYEICDSDWLCSQAKVTMVVTNGKCCTNVFFLLFPLCWFFSLFNLCFFSS